jgi:hypothetical protein
MSWCMLEILRVLDCKEKTLELSSFVMRSEAGRTCWQR